MNTRAMPADREPIVRSRDLYLRLLGYVMPHRRVFAASILALVVVALTEPAIPALMKPMLDGSFIDKDPAMIRLVPLGLVALFVVRGLATFAGNVAINWVASRLVRDLRERMFARLVRLPSAFYDHHSGGVLISRLTYDVTQVTDAATTGLVVLVRDTITVLGLVAWMLWTSWKLTLIVFVTVPLITLTVRLISGRLREMNRRLQDAMGDVTRVLQESIDCHRVVKVFGGQQWEQSRFAQAANWVRRYHMKREVAAQTNTPIVHLVIVIALAVIIYLASLESARDAMTVGGFVSFFTAMGLLFAPIKRITGVNQHLQRGLAASESVFALLDEPPEPDTGTVEAGRLRGHIEFDRVGYTYPGSPRPALEDIGFEIAAARTVALVGPSGSGKTTLASLLPRFMDVGRGAIRIDGTDIREFTLASLRDNIALVGQDVALFNDTLRANIAYGGMRDVTDAEVDAACEAAFVTDFIDTLPDGLDTVIGDKGVRLSGGQRQRVAIARALLKDAPILILDEATSSLDTVAERHIQRALETLRRGRTTLVIAHRLSTVEHADHIVVLDRGRVVESGRHAELLGRDGLYARLYREWGSAEPPAG